MSFVFEISANHDQVEREGERSAHASKNNIIKNPPAWRSGQRRTSPAAASGLYGYVDLPAGGECGCCGGWWPERWHVPVLGCWGPPTLPQCGLSLSGLRLDGEEDNGGERAGRDEGCLASASPSRDLSKTYSLDSVVTTPTLAAADGGPGTEPGLRRRRWSGQLGSLKGVAAIADVQRSASRDRSRGTIAPVASSAASAAQTRRARHWARRTGCRTTTFMGAGQLQRWLTVRAGGRRIGDCIK